MARRAAQDAKVRASVAPNIDERVVLQRAHAFTQKEPQPHVTGVNRGRYAIRAESIYDGLATRERGGLAAYRKGRFHARTHGHENHTDSGATNQAPQKF